MCRNVAARRGSHTWSMPPQFGSGRRQRTSTTNHRCGHPARANRASMRERTVLPAPSQPSTAAAGRRRADPVRTSRSVDAGRVDVGAPTLPRSRDSPGAPGELARSTASSAGWSNRLGPGGRRARRPGASTTANGRCRASSRRRPAAGPLIAANSSATPACWSTRTAAPSRCTARGRGYGALCRSTTSQAIAALGEQHRRDGQPVRPRPPTTTDARVRGMGSQCRRCRGRDVAAAHRGRRAARAGGGGLVRRRGRRGGPGRRGRGAAGAAAAARRAGAAARRRRVPPRQDAAATASPRTSSTCSTRSACRPRRVGARRAAAAAAHPDAAGSSTAPARRPNRVIRRAVFDAALVDAARRPRGGAAPPPGPDAGRSAPDRVVLDGEIAARAVVGADGANSVVRRLLGAPAAPPASTARRDPRLRARHASTRRR